MFVKGQCVIMTLPVETVKSEQLQNKEFKLTSCQTLLVNLFWFVGVFFPFSSAEYMKFYFLSVRINKHYVMPLQEEGNGTVSNMYVRGWWCYFQTEGEACIHETLLCLSPVT